MSIETLDEVALGLFFFLKTALEVLMQEFPASWDEDLSGLQRLIAIAPKVEFGSAALQFLSGIARIENFGAYHIADLSRPNPALSFWSGRITSYWFQRDAALILGSKDAQSRIISQIREARSDGVHIDRWHPKPGSKREEIYKRNGVLERVAVSSRDGRSGLRSFYLRSAADGLLDENEYEALCKVLPIVHGLIGLRHQIVGTARHGIDDGANATRLRDNNVGGFAGLTPRETEVCDLLLDGRSIAASALQLDVSEATIRTLRQRAYRKLKVGSARELMALFIQTPHAT
ncbi:helix-turn-helix transcriptional regulator [Shimia sp. Alg240-R146]|uniref:helix-turn-helix transcriptional regulator n=1 Tax=Shimia sp. Alg240-R146 TaxID=2993449 RepID=UPI0022E59F6B|nr:LuxR C-terminal-related transcriptional regulator [Shimia sp. Alg240-R146]